MNKDLIFEERFSRKVFTTIKSCGNMKDISSRLSFFESYGLNMQDLVLPEQVHGNNIVIVDEKDKGSFIKSCDALITGKEDIILGIFTADCMPIIIMSKDSSVRAAVHAGWKGLAGGIIEKTINVFKENFAIKPQDLKAYIGPHIQECCYEVSNEFEKIFNIKLNKGKFNMSAKAEEILNLKGVQEVYISDKCTFHNNELFFSYRKDKTDKRILTLV